MKKSILLFLLLLPLAGFAQSPIGLGFGTSYDFDVNLNLGNRFLPYASGKTSLFSFDVSLRVRLSELLNIYPTFIYSIPARTNLVSNPDGDYLPNGYTIKVPYKEENEGWTYYQFTEDYPDLISQAEVWQKSYGGFVTFGKDFEIGTGLFLRDKTTYVYSTMYYDEYAWYASEGTTWDLYSYNETYLAGVEEDTFRDVNLMVPLLVKYAYNTGNLYYGGAFVYWLGEDRYMSFRYTMGVNF